MAVKLGNDYKVYIESTTPGTYNVIRGQRECSRSGSQATFSLGNKDTAPYDPQAPGTKTVGLSLVVTPDLPDTNGYTRAETVANATSATPVGVQIRKSPYSGSDVVFEADMYITGFNGNFPYNGEVTTNMEFSLAAAPTVDALA